VKCAATMLLVVIIMSFAAPDRLEAAYMDKLDSDKGRTLKGVELIPRFHPVGTKPEVDIGARSERINRGEPVHGHFGQIAGLPNGDIVAAHNEQKTGSHSWDPTCRQLCRISSDGGYTWTLGVDVFKAVRDEKTKEPKIGHSYYALATQRDGTIWVGPAQLKDGKWHVPRSKDGGKTWDFSLIAPTRFIYLHEMSNGEMIAMGSEKHPHGTRTRAIYIYSPKTNQWQKVHLGDQSGYELDEGVITETHKPGEIYLLLRDQDRGHYYYNTWSSDYGRTWHGYSPSGVWYSLRPSRPFVTRGEGGMLLAVNAERSNGRIVVTPSFDNGRTWDLTRRIFVLDSPEKFLKGSHGYCSMAPSGPNTWLVTWYSASFYGTNIDISYITHPFQGARLSADAKIDNAKLIARWSFEGSDRNIIQGVPYCDYGRATLVARKAGKIGKGGSFNGKNSFVEIRDTPTMRVPNFFTIDCFFKADRLEGEQALISKRPYYYLGLSGNKVTFQIGDPPENKTKRPTFRIDSEVAVKPRKWYHLAVTVGTVSRSYKSAKIFLDGKQVAFINLSRSGMGRGWDYYKAAYYLDDRPEKGPRFLNYARFAGYHAHPSYHLCLGVDNVTKKNHFKGLLDEVTLYGRCFTPLEVEKLGQRGYGIGGPGVIVTDPIKLDGPEWGLFQAEVDIFAKTAIKFDVLDGNGEKVLKTDVKPGASLADIKADPIRLRATLTSEDPRRTPILKSWAITGSMDD